MRKRIDLNRYYYRVDKGMGKIFIQDGEEYDRQGWSLKEYPEPEKVIHLPKSQKPYATEKVAIYQLSKMTRVNKDKCTIVPYEDGYAIVEEVG